LDKDKRHIAILGSTGSIGTQAIEVIRAHPEYFQVEVLTANNNAELLIQQAIDLQPNAVVIGNEEKYDEVSNALSSRGIKVYAGARAIDSVVEMEAIDVVLAAMVGFAGLSSTISAIKANKQIALANKETLVVAGHYITGLARKHGVNIYPVDSEHSAIFQCMVGEFHNKIERILLTASGGPFRGRTLESLRNVSKAEALKHPNWSMGSKITIDSATMMNKGLEVIEAKWLFNLTSAQIEVVVHPQSIVHSLVEFEDGSIKAQLGLPDMRIPIQFALSYPNRLKSAFPRFSFADYPVLNFEKPDMGTFRNLALAYTALDKCGNMPCTLNAANEIAVDAFLKDKIKFLQIPDVIEDCMQHISHIATPDLEDLLNTDKETRIKAKEIIK
jgi:1-deoxy-D-xylulose-5-phosphate reductoisomerase